MANEASHFKGKDHETDFVHGENHRKLEKGEFFRADSYWFTDLIMIHTDAFQSEINMGQKPPSKTEWWSVESS